MALAPVVYTLWQEFLRFDPGGPDLADRDRFVLSCGHASMLLYSMLHLAGVQAARPEGKKTGELAVPLSEIQRFRQLGQPLPRTSRARGVTTGVETTTGPLGQGIAELASAWRVRAALPRRALRQAGLRPFTLAHLVLCSDGGHDGGHTVLEAASIAGHLQKLSRLCWIYDNNRITIEGKTGPRVLRGSRRASAPTAGRR
jgi:transketolase